MHSLIMRRLHPLQQHQPAVLPKEPVLTAPSPTRFPTRIARSAVFPWADNFPYSVPFAYYTYLFMTDFPSYTVAITTFHAPNYALGVY